MDNKEERDLLDADRIDSIIKYDESYDSIYFKNRGVYNQGLYIENKKIVGTITLDQNITVKYSLTFSKNTFSGHLAFGGSQFEKHVNFTDCVFEEKVVIGITIFRRNGTDNKNIPTVFSEHLIFKNCTFKKGLSILSGIFDSFYTENCNFPVDTSVSHGFSDSIYLGGGYFKQGFAVLGGAVDGNINVNGGHYLMSLYFGRNVTVNGIITVLRGLFTNIEIADASINKLVIGDSYRHYIPEIIIGKGVKKLEIHPINQSEKKRSLMIKKLEFRDSPDLAIISNNCIIQECIFTNHAGSSSSNVSLLGIIVERLIFSNYNNYGKITIANLTPRKKNSFIKSSNSNLGTIDFISCDLSKYSLIIDNSKLVNIFYTSTKFPDEIKSDKKEEAMVSQLRDTYDQLQTVAAKQGDRVSSLKWQHKSLKYYFSSLSPDKRKWWILLFMRVSNNFRMSSGLAVLFTLIIGLFFFSLYALALNHELAFGIPERNDTKNLIDSLNLYFPSYWEFINPTHKANFVDTKPCSPGWANFFDILGRLFVGFGIYQFIQAFRRYGKGD